MPTTPDIETILVAKTLLLLPADFRALSETPDLRALLIPGPLRPVTSSILVRASFLQLVAGEDHYRWRKFQVQLTHRFSRGNYVDAEGLARRCHDSLSWIGRFSQDGVIIVDVQPRAAGPQYVGVGDEDAEFFVEDFDVWYDG